MWARRATGAAAVAAAPRGARAPIGAAVWAHRATRAATAAATPTFARAPTGAAAWERCGVGALIRGVGGVGVYANAGAVCGGLISWLVLSARCRGLRRGALIYDTAVLYDIELEQAQSQMARAICR